MIPDPNPCRWPRLAAERWPQVVALIDGDRELTFGALDREIQRLANALHNERPGPVIGIAFASRYRTALLCLAAPRAGLIPYPLNPDMPPAERDRLLYQAGAHTLVTSAEFEQGPGLRRLDPARLDGAVENDAAGWADSAGLQLILATSGSGGRAKGVLHSGVNLAASVSAFLDRWPLNPGDRWLACLPPFHIGGLAIMYRCLAAGATAELHERFDVDRVWEALQRGRVSHISLVPAMLAALLERSMGTRAPSSLRMVLVGGAPLASELARRASSAGWPLCVSYGMTETAAVCAADCGAEAGEAPGVAGPLLPGFEAAVGADGRLRLRGPALMAGYANPGLRPGFGLDGGWLVTGDLGVIDESGRLQVFGRADEVLVSAGELVHPLQVERLLTDCPGVREAAVGGLPDPFWGELVVAWYLGDSEPQAVADWCRERLPSYLRPRRIRRVETLPTTGPGKLDRARLRTLIAALEDRVGGG